MRDDLNMKLWPLYLALAFCLAAWAWATVSAKPPKPDCGQIRLQAEYDAFKQYEKDCDAARQTMLPPAHETECQRLYREYKRQMENIAIDWQNCKGF